MTTQSGNPNLTLALGQLGDELRARLEKSPFKLPLLPEVANRVASLSMEVDSDAADLATLIHRDQSLASHVLRVANSAANGGGARIVSLQQAVSRLGMKSLREIALTASLHSGTFNAPRCRSLVDRYWRRSLASALYAREIARLRRCNLESAFLSGLLHQVGKPVALASLMQLQRSRNIELNHHDQATLVQELHVDIGIKLSQEWNLPAPVTAVIEFAERHREAPSLQDDVATVFLAGLLARFTLNVPEQEQAEIEHHDVVEDLHLYPDDLGELFDKRAEILQSVEATNP